MCCAGADAAELGEVKTSTSFTVLFFSCEKSEAKNISKWQAISRTSLMSVVLKRTRAEKQAMSVQTCLLIISLQ